MEIYDMAVTHSSINHVLSDPGLDIVAIKNMAYHLGSLYLDQDTICQESPFHWFSKELQWLDWDERILGYLS